MSLYQEILEILDYHSGGIKFTELIVDLAARHPVDIDDVEAVIRESKDIKILNYTWLSVKRAKMFIYTP